MFNEPSTAQPLNEDPEGELIGAASFLGHFVEQLEGLIESLRLAEGVDEEVEVVGLRGDTYGEHVGVQRRGQWELGSEGLQVCNGLVDVAQLGEDSDHGSEGRVWNVVHFGGGEDAGCNL